MFTIPATDLTLKPTDPTKTPDIITTTTKVEVILTDKILEELKCSNCQKYLSIFPIKVYTNRQILCGRCCKQDDHGRTSMYNQLIGNMRFRCVNRYDGCNSLLTPNEMKEHESSCIAQNYDCLICKTFSGTSYDILHHLQREHRLKNFDGIHFLDLDQNGENYYLNVEGDVIFLIYINIDPILNKLMFCCVNIGPENRAKQIKSELSLFNTNQLITKKSKPCSVAISNDSSFNFDLESLKARTRIVHCKLKLDTTFVNNCYNIKVVQNLPQPINLKFGETTKTKDQRTSTPRSIVAPASFSPFGQSSFGSYPIGQSSFGSNPIGQSSFGSNSIGADSSIFGNQQYK